MNRLKESINKALYKISVKVGFAQLYFNPTQKEEIVSQFHKLYYNSYLENKTWKDSYFLGIPTQKCPFDLFVYQEILFDTKPDLIIEAGTASGGGALFLASICELMNHGEVVTIDIVDVGNRPEHKRLKYLMGSSTSEEVVSKVKEMSKGKKKVMVILDSNHSKEHVLAELKIYHELVSKDCYLIVEDTNVNGHPVQPMHGPGPMEALNEFLESNADFITDETREKHYVSFNPKGYLRKTKS